MGDGALTGTVLNVPMLGGESVVCSYVVVVVVVVTIYSVSDIPHFPATSSEFTDVQEMR